MIIWKLNEIMALRRFSGKVLAEKLDIHPNTISRLRKTDEMPTINGDLLEKLCIALSCSPYDLIEYIPALPILLVGTTVISIIFWNVILDWTSKTLSPWIMKNLPWLSDYIIDAFVSLDTIITPIRNKTKTFWKSLVFSKVKEAWRIVRQYLLKVSIQFEEDIDNQWIRKIIWWVTDNSQFKKIVHQEVINIDLLPDEIKKWFELVYVEELSSVDLSSDNIQKEQFKQDQIIDVTNSSLLPDEIRKEWLKQNNITQNTNSNLLANSVQKEFAKKRRRTPDIDVTHLRDYELNEIEKLHLIS